MSDQKVIFKVQDAKGCPLYKVGDCIVFSLPAVEGEAGCKICASFVASAYPLALALTHGVPFENVGEGKDNEGIFYCPGGIEGRVTFTVVRKKAKEPTLTMVIGRKDREKEKDVDFIVDHLKKIDLFTPLPMSSIETIIPALELKRFAEGTSIIQQGAPGEFLYILIKGAVDIIQTSEDGIENTLASLDRGEVFGEMSLLSNEPCSATVRARSPLSVLAMSKENFLKILGDNPSLNIYFNKLLVQRLRRQNVQVDEEISKGVLGKLSMITLPELTQTLQMSNRTGTLFIYTANGRGEIFFKDGQVFDSNFGDEKGDEAFYSMLALKGGNFRFMEGEVDIPRNIRLETMGLLMEGLRRLDEKARAS